MNIQNQLDLPVAQPTKPATGARFRTIWHGIPVILAGLGLMACTPNPADARSSTPGRMAQVHQACAGAMQLNPSEALYEGCVGSLLQTLSEMDQAQLVQRDRRACMARGLQPGTPAFATCVVDAEEPIASN